jgi:predicted NUDIX family NTP pyrophosphohydrolase
MFRRRNGAVELLLGHPGGPFWAAKDEGAWTIPKGLIGPGETQDQAARREFAEETGHRPNGNLFSLGSVRQPGGKMVHAWAIAGDWDPAALRSNMFELEWPPRSGRRQSFPEIDRAEWFTVPQARKKILKGQAIFIDRLLQAIDAANDVEGA